MVMAKLTVMIMPVVRVLLSVYVVEKMEKQVSVVTNSTMMVMVL